MKIAINAGHTKIGKGTGACKYLNESVETRKIVCEIMSLLANTEHEVIPIIIDKSTDNLKEVVNIANKEKCDLLISVHLNAGGGRGTEVYTWKGEKTSLAKKANENLSNLGFLNRGIRDGSGFYVIKKTKMETLLIEVCFVDSETDVKLYKELGVKKIANAIAKSI